MKIFRYTHLPKEKTLKIKSKSFYYHDKTAIMYAFRVRGWVLVCAIKCLYFFLKQFSWFKDLVAIVLK